MDTNKAKVVLESNNVIEDTEFFKHNLESKLANLQAEHLLVLKVFYEIDAEVNLSKLNKEFQGFIDVSFATVQSKVNLSVRIIEVCYNDLLRDGLIIMTHQQMLYHYITPLGKKLINHILEN